MPHAPLTAEQIADYRRDGFVLARSLFDDEEIQLLRRAAKEDKDLDDHSYSKADGEGGKVYVAQLK